MHLAARWSSGVSQHLAQVVVTNLGAASVPFVTSLPAPEAFSIRWGVWRDDRDALFENIGELNWICIMSGL